MAGPALVTSAFASNPAATATPTFTGPTLTGHVGKSGIMCIVSYTNPSGPNLPSGWTLIGSGNIGSSGGQTTVFFYSKASLVSGDSNLSLSTVDTGSAYWFAEILVFDAGAVVVASQADAISDGGSGTITTTTVTVGTNETVAVLGAMVSAAPSWNTPSPLTQDIDSAGPFSSLEMVGYHKQSAASGAWAKTFTWTNLAGATRNGALLTLRIALGNHAPVANAQSVTVNQDSTANNITCVATDADSDPLTYSIVSGPSHGSVGAFTGAVVQYTPTPGYNGSDSFTFKANDGIDDSNTATVTITVTARSAPVLSAFASSSVSDVQATVGAHLVSEVDVASSWHVEWGLTGSYGHTEATDTVALNTAADVTFRIRNLEPGKTYHWRIVATNTHGTTNGADQTFTTSAPPAYRFGRLASGVGS